MVMPERSFGRTVRYRRTKLGLSQAKLAELVGRSTPTIRSWERDKSRPNDPKVLSALAAILGVDEKHLFDKAEVDRPVVETSPTVEQALATLSPEENAVVDAEEPVAPVVISHDPTSDTEPEPVLAPVAVVAEDYAIDLSEFEVPSADELESAGSKPGFVAPPDGYHQTPLTPTLTDISYIEDSSQRQLYRVRTLATIVALVALAIAFMWAIGESIGALGDWWDDFFGNLRI